MKKIPSKTIHVFDPSKLKDHIDETIPLASIDRYAYEGGVDVTVTKYYCDDF